MREPVPAVQVWENKWMMHCSIRMLYFREPFSFMSPVFAHCLKQAVANSYTVHSTALSGVSNIEPSALHVQEILFFTQRFSEELLLVKKRLLVFA